MGDSTEMTIEFLRARLLSERSVSRAARQRADQLAKRVMELEEQLRIVTVQRKKAEKAAAEVLAILETQGIGDLSEAIDSSSDGEPRGDTLKEYESSTASRMERSEVEDVLSGSEPEVSLSQSRSLSWKNRSNSPDSHDKETAKQPRQKQRRRSFMSTLQSSSKHELGKSCRKIKRKDVGSAADSETQKPTLLDAQENGGFTCSSHCDDQPKVSLETPRGMTEEAVADTSDSHHVDDHNRQTEDHSCAAGSGIEEEMETVLEKQAKLIVQFQAEENAQREWEENYNENKMPTLADYEPGNQSLIAEKRSQSKEEFSELADRTPDYDEEITLGAVNISSTEEPKVESLSRSEKNDRSEEASNLVFSSGFMPGDTIVASTGKCSHVQGNDLVGQQCDDTAAKEAKTVSQKFTVSGPERYGMIRSEKQNKTILHDVSNNGYPSNSRSHPRGNRILEDTSSRTNFTIDDHSKLPKLGSQQKNQMQLQRQLSQAPSSSLGGVLEALHRAKLSLSQELSKQPSLNQGTLALAPPTNSQTRAIASADGLDIPIGSASLFRLPTDSFPPAQVSAPEFYGSGLSWPANRPDVGYTTRNPTTTYVEDRSRVVQGREYFDNYFGSSMGLPGSNRYSRASSDLSAEGVSFRSEFSKSYSDLRNGLPPGDRYALYGGNHTRL